MRKGSNPKNERTVNNMKTEAEVQNITEQIKRDVELAHYYAEKKDWQSASYNEGLARGKLSALYNVGKFNESDLVHWTNYINKNI